MGSRKKILAIYVSTKADSVNVHILSAIAAMYSGEAAITPYTGIDHIPHFNPDLDTDNGPAAVGNFRK